MSRFIFLFFVAGLSGAFAQTPETRLTQALERISDKYYEQPMPLSLGKCYYQTTNLEAPFSRTWEGLVLSAISPSKKLKFIAVEGLSTLEPRFKKDFAGVFDLRNVKNLLSARYFPEGDRIRVDLEVMSFETSTLVGKETLYLKKSELPAGVLLEPADLGRAQRLSESLGRILRSESSSLEVAATLERGTGAAYRKGDEVVIYVVANRDAYLKVYSIGPDDSTVLLFPNTKSAGGRNNLIPGNKLVKIPGPGHGFKIRVNRPPYGQEVIKIVASTTPFKDLEKDFTVLGTDGAGIITRGLDVETDSTTEGAMAEATLQFSSWER